MEEGLLRNVPPEQCFRLVNGRVLKNLHELSNALVSMDQGTFSHHVTREKNDFANWILGVFKDEGLSRQIAAMKSREAVSRRVLEALKAEGRKMAAQPVEQAREEQKKNSALEKIKRFFPKRKKEQPSVEQKSGQDHQEIQRKLDLILQREKEIAEREKKLLEIEKRIEKRLPEERDHRMFSNEFVQGFFVGFLTILVLVLMYVKFVMQA